jgi:putative flippase GtrA
MQILQGDLLKFIKFGIVGFSGLLIDFALTWLLKEKARISPYLANAVGFIVAASSNWYLNRIWSFESQNSHLMEEYVAFLLVSLLGLLINTAVLFVGINKFKLNFYVAKAVAIAVTTFWNFFANYYYTFAG